MACALFGSEVAQQQNAVPIRVEPKWDLASAGCRIGEAANPGPKYILGAVNPSGLMHKASLLAELPVGVGGTVYSASETQLTKLGQAQFRRELSITNSRYQLLPGAAVAPKTQSLGGIGGKHLGVAFLTDQPGRNVTPTWKTSDWEDARFHVGAFHLAGQWMIGGGGVRPSLQRPNAYSPSNTTPTSS